MQGFYFSSCGFSSTSRFCQVAPAGCMPMPAWYDCSFTLEILGLWVWVGLESILTVTPDNSGARGQQALGALGRLVQAQEEGGCVCHHVVGRRGDADCEPLDLGTEDLEKEGPGPK